MIDEQRYQYQVVARVELDDGFSMDLTSDWDSRRDWAVDTAKALEERGVEIVQINSRPVAQHVDWEEVP